jgi:hypothetical protein
MSNLPTHSDSSGSGDEGRASRGINRKALLGIVAVVLLIVIMIVLHVTGVVGPEAH